MTSTRGNLILSGILLAGLAGMLLLGRDRLADLRDARAVRAWRPTPCTILESGFNYVERPVYSEVYSELAYLAEVRYRYTVGGRTYESTALAPGYTGSADAAAEHRRARRYAAGDTATCYVAPDDPRRAYLERAGPWYLGLLGPLFIYMVAYVAFLLHLIWRGSVGGGHRLATAAAAFAVSPLALIGVFMLGLGVAMGSESVVRPLTRLADMDDWRAADCRLITVSARWTVTEPGGDFPVVVGYDILYAYNDGTGRTFISNHYSAFSLLADDEPDALPGATIPCWYDPHRPSRSVLERGFSGDPIKFALVSLVCLATGVVLLWLSGVWVRFTYRERRGAPSYGRYT